MKKTVIFSFLAICLLALTGCVETPKEVKENMKKYGDETKKIANVEVTYCKPDQVEASVEKAKKLSLQNFKLPEKIDFSSIKQLSTLEMQVPTDFKKHADEIAKLCGLNIPKWEEDKGNFRGDESLIYDDEKKGIYAFAADNGVFEVSKIEPTCDEKEYKLTNRINTGDPKECNQSCKLNGKTSTISKEISYTEKELKKRFKNLIPNFNFTISSVWVYDKKDGNQRLEFQGNMQWKGTPYYHYCQSTKEKTYDVLPDIRIATEKKEDLQVIAFDGTIYNFKSEKKVDKVVDFPSAVKLVEKKLSGFKPYDIDKVQVLYRVQLEPGDKVKEAFLPLLSGMEIKLNPVYAFIIYNKKVSPNNDNVVTYEGNSTGVVFVDMVTGKVSVELGNLKK